MTQAYGGSFVFTIANDAQALAAISLSGRSASVASFRFPAGVIAAICEPLFARFSS
jgi:hypothetical protein